MKKGKQYLIAPTFAQLDDPLNSKANLQEDCGQVIDTITVVNLYPGYIIREVA